MVVILYAVGAESAIEDTTFGAALAIVAAVGLLGSLVAFVLALVRIRVERWKWLWLPICVFPAIMLFLVLGEAFWWE